MPRQQQRREREREIKGKEREGERRKKENSCMLKKKWTKANNLICTGARRTSRRKKNEINKYISFLR